MMSNYFELLSIENSFSIDKNKLEQNYQELISSQHPDKFVQKSEAEKAKATQNTSLINTAYQVLSDDLKRANYLLELAGINAFDEKDTNMDVDFLMAQIEYRETLEQLAQDQDAEAIENFVDEINKISQAHIVKIGLEFTQNNLEMIKNLVRELRFYQQLAGNANQLLDEL